MLQPTQFRPITTFHSQLGSKLTMLWLPKFGMRTEFTLTHLGKTQTVKRSLLVVQLLLLKQKNNCPIREKNIHLPRQRTVLHIDEICDKNTRKAQSSYSPELVSSILHLLTGEWRSDQRK